MSKELEKLRAEAEAEAAQARNKICALQRDMIAMQRLQTAPPPDSCAVRAWLSVRKEIARFKSCIINNASVQVSIL